MSLFPHLHLGALNSDINNATSHFINAIWKDENNWVAPSHALAAKSRYIQYVHIYIYLLWTFSPSSENGYEIDKMNIQNTFLPGNTSPDVGTVAVECTAPQKHLVKNTIPKGLPNLSTSVLQTDSAWGTLTCTVFVWRKDVVCNVSSQFQQSIPQRFESSQREKQSSKESHGDTLLGMCSHVNWIMEVFILLGHVWFALNFIVRSRCCPVIYHLGKGAPSRRLFG